MKTLCQTFILIFLSSFIYLHANSQQEEHGIYDTIRVYSFTEENGEKVPGGWLEPVTVHAKMTEAWKKYWKEWTRLRNAVYVTYPYAITASRVMKEINAQLVNVKDKKQRKAIIHSREKELKRDFADKLTNLSVYQGKVLMKLIYRETGDNCYEIIDEYKGGFTVAVWQTVALVFGSNLRQNYNPSGADEAMEYIVKDVEKMYGRR
ncbi:MAG: hypothetical protein JWN76_629 [Chitinophagaceae bacterium]|nr:hypothetical protein [Chitinophagaceae bacterium]